MVMASPEWDPPSRGPRSRGHASLMTGSFTTAMGATPAALGISTGASPGEEIAPLQRASSSINLSRKSPGPRRPPRSTPSPLLRDKLDRTVSTPNIAQASSKKLRQRSGFGGSTCRFPDSKSSLENVTEHATLERSRSGKIASTRKSPPLANYSMTSSMYLASTSSSSFFDRLAQPRRLSTQNEEEPLETRRNSGPRPARPAFKPPLKPMATKSKEVKSERVKESPKPIRESPKPGRDSPKPLSKESPRLGRNSPKPNNEVPKSVRRAAKPAKRTDESDSSQASKPAVVVRDSSSERPAVPPCTLSFSQTVQDGLQEADSPSSARSEPTGPSLGGPMLAAESQRSRKNSGGLKAPSPSQMMTKGSAPSTPTGQRSFPRSPSKEISEEEYKQRLAEQRRLARERMAAQEAERKAAIEEERRRQEEAARKLREEAERQRKEEEEKDREEREKREEEEREKREAEAKKKAEEERQREEEERKRQELLRQTRENLEQIERQREEQKRIEEQHRIERKKRLESIMSRVKKSTDLSGSRESLTSSHLDLTSNGLDEDRPLSPAPQFKSALLQSMLSKGRLSNSIRAVSALRRSEGQSGSTGSLIADIRNLSRSTENLASGSNSTSNIAASAAGDMTTSQIEDQLSPPPVVNPAMWRSHPNGIPGLSGHRISDEERPKNGEEITSSIRISAEDAEAISGKEGSFARQTSVRFEVQLPHGSEDDSWIASSANREVADLMS